MQKKAFTLIEVILVVTIIGIITAAAVLSYQGAARRHKMWVYEKQLNSVAEQAKAEVRAGKIGTEDDGSGTVSEFLYCLGIHFQTGEEPTKIVAVYDSTAGTCGSPTYEEFDLSDEDIYVHDMEIVYSNSTATISTVDLLYVPPGDMNLWTSLDSNGQLLYGDLSVRLEDVNDSDLYFYFDAQN